ncbi:MAG TPA: VOC family protein [Chitinophagaceae bacterium]|nr:VOC family protein [Chitinophagaceae bacterium]
MGRIILSLLVSGLLATIGSNYFSNNKPKRMKLNAGIITSKLNETKKFYRDVLGFGVRFESDWYILLHTPDGNDEIAFLQPEHPGQAPVFQPAFNGKGVFLTIEVEDVDAEYKRIKELKIPIVVELKNEDWGDRHFAIMDPNGVGIDIVKHTAPGS